MDLIKPLAKRWKGTGGKITNEELNDILKRNGFDELKRTNQDVRDSVLIALVSYGWEDVKPTNFNLFLN